jgi:hypothetical protein
METRETGVRIADLLSYTEHPQPLVSTQHLQIVATFLSPGVMRKEHYKYVVHPPSTEIKIRGALYFFLPKSLCLIKYWNNSSVLEDMINYKVSN